MKLSEEDKVNIIQLRKDGCTLPYIAKKYKIAISHIKTIIARYYETGSIEVAHKKRKFSADFKYSIVKEVLTGASINSLVIKHRLSSPTVSLWMRKYNELGYNGLKDIKQGRPKKIMNEPNKSEINNIPLSDSEREELNRLRAENEYLKMERDYLKKLRALVQKRQAKQQKKK